jgi:predicted Fe-Mo cluster-binding NifX family protein
MKIAIPVEKYAGLESAVYGHFGSAPVFALVDTETLAVEPLENRDLRHAHGACSPMRALANRRPDAIVVGGIGMGALLGLRAAGIRVYRCVDGSVADAVRLLNAGQLEEISEQGACAGHAGGHTCHHG